MRCLVRVVVVVAAALATALPARAAHDVLGWRNTTWSMTEPEVRKAVEGLGLRPVPVPVARARGSETLKTSIEIDGQAHEVVFEFSADRQVLDRVVMGGADLPRDPALKLHKKFVRTLTETFGVPTEAETRGTLLSVTRWIFETTTVTANLYTDTAAPGRRLTQVSVIYAPTPKKSTDRARLLSMGLYKLFGEAARH